MKALALILLVVGMVGCQRTYAPNREVGCDGRLIREWNGSEEVHDRTFEHPECYPPRTLLPAGDYVVYRNGKVNSFYVDGLRYDHLPQ